MAESVSNDRAIEALGRAIAVAYNEPFEEWHVEVGAPKFIEALAGAGLQITDLTPTEVRAVLSCSDWVDDEDVLQGEDEYAALRRAVAELRRLSEANDAGS